jgi:hypothetical protein
VAALAQSDIAAVAPGIVLDCNTRPMIDCMTQTDVRCVAPYDHTRLATLFSYGRNARQSPERLVIAAAERPRSLGERYGEIDPADSRHGLQYPYIMRPAAELSKCRLRFI